MKFCMKSAAQFYLVCCNAIVPLWIASSSDEDLAFRDHSDICTILLFPSWDYQNLPVVIQDSILKVEYYLAGYVQMVGTLFGCSNCLVSIMFPP